MVLPDDRSITAIPTTYRGVEFKSRFEAQAALLFDLLDWEWEYEPQSFMLPNGVPYTPDFLVPGQNLFVECRGYDSPKGRLQIAGFAGLVADGVPFGIDGEIARDFLVLYGDAEACYFSDGGRTGMAMLVHCTDCGWTLGNVGSPGGYEFGVPRAFCGRCTAPMGLIGWRKWDGKTRIDKLAAVTVSKGKILVNGMESAFWASSGMFSEPGNEPFNPNPEDIASAWENMD